MIKLSTYVPPDFSKEITPNSLSSKSTKSVTLLILWETRLSKRAYHINTIMARPESSSTLQRVPSVFHAKKLLETDTLRRDCMFALNISDTQDVVMVKRTCVEWALILDFLRRVKENAEKRKNAKVNESKCLSVDSVDY